MNAKTLPPLLPESPLAVAPLALPADPVSASPATATPSAEPALLSEAQLDSVSAGATSLLSLQLNRFTPTDPVRPISAPSDPVRPISLPTDPIRPKFRF